MDAFATIEDLQARFRVLDPQEAARAEALLMDASVMIATAMADSGVDMYADELSEANMRRVCCAMVSRALCTEAAPDPTYAFGGNLVATASGELYMKRAEKTLLGIGRGRIAFVEAG